MKILPQPRGQRLPGALRFERANLGDGGLMVAVVDTYHDIQHLYIFHIYGKIRVRLDSIRLD